MELIIFTGIPASGKSSFYKEHFFNTHVRINLDMLKNRKAEEMLFMACLWAQRNLVIDNTNMKRSERAVYINAAKKHNCKRIIGYFFDAEVPACIDRNILRGRPIPNKVIGIKYQQLEIPKLMEGFRKLHKVTLSKTGFLVQEVK